MSLYRIYYTGIKENSKQTWIIEDQSISKVHVVERLTIYVPVEFTPGNNGPRPCAVAWATGRLEVDDGVGNIYPEEMFRE